MKYVYKIYKQKTIKLKIQINKQETKLIVYLFIAKKNIWLQLRKKFPKEEYQFITIWNLNLLTV